MYQQPNHSYSSTDSLRRLSSNNPFRQHVQAQAQVQVQQPQASTQPTQQTRTNVSPPYQRQHSYSPKKSSSLSNSSTHFDDWVEKNKQLIQNEYDEYTYYNGNQSKDLYQVTSSGSDQNDIINLYTSPNKQNNSEASGPRHRSSSHRLSSTSTSTLSTNNSTKIRPPQPPQPIRSNSDPYYNRRMSNNPFLNPPQSNDTHNNNINNNNNNTPNRSHTPPARPPKASEVDLPPPSYEEAAGREAAKREFRNEKESSSSSRPRRSSRDQHHHHHRSKNSNGEKSSSGNKKSSSRSSKKKDPVQAKNLDTIDKLDVTGFFGGGFHHDGPFDACTPARNANSKKAPVKAFPINGANMSIAGGANLNKDDQMNMAFGYNDVDEMLGGAKSQSNPSILNFDANAKASPVHGSTTLGLGSSTFLNGAPAPKAAAAVNEENNLNLNNGGLGRKKSLVQRLRKNSGSESSTRRSSNDGLYSAVSDGGRRGSLNTLELNEDIDDELKPPSGNSFIRRVKSLKVRK